MLRTTERIRRISPTELEDVVTIHDPDYYSRDWQARFVYRLRNDVRIEDYICGFEHRDISSVVGVRAPGFAPARLEHTPHGVIQHLLRVAVGAGILAH